MDSRQYAQIQYDPNDLGNAKVTEVIEVTEKNNEAQISETLVEEMQKKAQSDALEDQEDVSDVDRTADAENVIEQESNAETTMDKEESHTETDTEKESYTEMPAETFKDQDTSDSEISDTYKNIEEIKEDIENIYGTMRRLEKKFESEILNAQTKDSMVKTMYQELNEYKAGLIEKAMKNVLYDVIDIREMMFAKAKHVREKEGANVISLEEFESYAEDIGDILEKYDVTIYKGEPGVENTAVRQKIVRKVETEDASLVKKVSESLSFGYEYNGKILYPEKIGIYVKKKAEQNK